MVQITSSYLLIKKKKKKSINKTHINEGQFPKGFH